MKRTIALFFCAALAACGGGGSNTPTVSSIEGKNLSYGATAEFDLSGTNLDLNKGLSLNVPNCVGQTPVFSSSVQQVFRCTVTATGELTVQVLDGAGAVMFAKSFTVPAPQVAMVTSLGNMVVELNPNLARLTVNNFLNYVQSGFYSNTLFHRVIAGFVIQGGGFVPGLSLRPGASAPIALESNNGLSNVRGAIAMARSSDPNSATSQFYFNLADNPALDYQDANNPGYAVFGKLVQGLDIMDAIGATPTNTVSGIPDVPVTDVIVKAAVRIK